MRIYFGLLICLLFFFSNTQKTHAQTIELMGGNTLNGAINGTILGGAVMGLSNSTNFTPLRVGLGTGILYGVGVGAYDVSTSEGNAIVVSGLFNDGYNSSIIVLLDTFYGAAAGAIVGTSVMLIAGQPLIDGLQYGSSAGTIAGFGVGLVDAFMLSERTESVPVSARNDLRNRAPGMASLMVNENASIGFVSPSIITRYSINPSKVETSLNVDPTINFINVKLNF